MVLASAVPRYILLIPRNRARCTIGIRGAAVHRESIYLPVEVESGVVRLVLMSRLQMHNAICNQQDRQ